jgi:hypothetical protein
LQASGKPKVFGSKAWRCQGKFIRTHNPACGTAQKLNLTAGGFDNQNTGRKALIAAEPVTGRIS